MKIKNYKERIKNMRFMNKFLHDMDFIENVRKNNNLNFTFFFLLKDINTLYNSVNSILTSKHLKDILAIYLGITNYINDSKVQGFSISSLPSISDHLTVNRKSSIGRFIYNLLEKNESEIINIVDELSYVPLGVSIDIDNSMSEMKGILKEINDINKELDKIEEFIQSDEANNNKEMKYGAEIYFSKLLDFATEALKRFEDTEKLIEDTKKKIVLLTEKLGESKTTKVFDMLNPIKLFLKTFKN